MTTPLVSVIMAAFNVGSIEVLDAAISSIVAQDMEQWELLICDDASSDGTYERLLEWGAQDTRIHVLRNESNRKSAAARNRCLEQARGQYIAIMDADDVCSHNRLRAQVEFLSVHPEFSFVGLRGERFSLFPGDTDNPYWFCKTPRPKDFLMTLPFVHASVMFRREAIDSVDGYSESPWAERSEDYDMLLRLYEKGQYGTNLDHAVYYIREDSSTLRRRKYRYRIKEAAVKLRGFARLGLMPKGFLYALKPLVVGLIPQRLLKSVKERYYRKQTEQSLKT